MFPQNKTIFYHRVCVTNPGKREISSGFPLSLGVLHRGSGKPPGISPFLGFVILIHRLFRALQRSFYPYPPEDEPSVKSQRQKMDTCQKSRPAQSPGISYADIARRPVPPRAVDRLLENAVVWGRIFNFLGVKERIRLEMTSKR